VFALSIWGAELWDEKNMQAKLNIYSYDDAL
jgi:hypothetical protein